MENSYFTDAELTSLRAKICDILGDDEKPLITFEGNIGAGKSTFVKTFIENLGDGLSKKLIEEPLDKWMDLAGENLLAQMYQDPAKTFLFQTYVLVTMLEKGVSDPEGALLISERSIDSA